MHATINRLQQQAETKEVVIAALQEVDYDNLSPKQALDLLWRLKEGIF